MSYAIRRHAAGLAVAGVLVALPLFGSAALAAPDSQEVAFSEGGPGVLCGSTPATPNITVPADSELRLINSLGQAATLRIDGQDAATVAKGDSVDVRFHRGPVSVAMVPRCPLNLNQHFKTLTVDVTPRSGPVTPAAGGAPRAGSSSTPGAAKSSPRPTATPSTVTAGPDDEAVLPILSSDPLFPDEISGPPAAGAETPAGAGVEPPATVVNVDGSQARALTGRELPVDNGPIGLLAVIATVCVVGVSAGAIRAIIAQRATRFA
jgi:hypothetical protein